MKFAQCDKHTRCSWCVDALNYWQAYNERRMCDEAETFVLVRRVEIELDREVCVLWARSAHELQARMRGEVEEALRVELRKHNLEYYADELHRMGAER